MKQHSDISAWLSQANLEGWYSFCVAAIEAGKEQGLQSIEEFNSLLLEAKKEGILAGEQKLQNSKEREADFKLSMKRRAYIKKVLRVQGYEWVALNEVDSAQGETGAVDWQLFKGDKPINISQALKEIAESDQVIAQAFKSLGI